MKSSVCTLFEGEYHHGVGALANSLFARGFRGVLYVGYRGSLPPWLSPSEKCNGFTEFKPAENLTLRLIPIETDAHLTNYKPDFMLQLLETHCRADDALFYFDPDITIKCRWTFFEEWVRCGIALCADVNFCMPSNHPTRNAWKNYYQPFGITFCQESDFYFNGGFIGVHKGEIKFLECWRRLQQLMAKELGGLKDMNVGEGTTLFRKTDQDALNVACMASDCPISPVGPQGMDFQYGGGGNIMSHAIGEAKPWGKKFVRIAILRSSAPSRADKEYFKHVKHPIELYSGTARILKTLELGIASAMGRFVRRA